MVNIILEYDHSLINKPTVNLPLLPTILLMISHEMRNKLICGATFFFCQPSICSRSYLKQVVQEISKHSIAGREKKIICLFSSKCNISGENTEHPLHTECLTHIHFPWTGVNNSVRGDDIHRQVWDQRSGKL